MNAPQWRTPDTGTRVYFLLAGAAAALVSVLAVRLVLKRIA